MKNPYTIHTLQNGLQLVIEQMPGVRSAAAGFLARTGARDETPEEAGISHFLEHMMFKGTSQRSWRDITIDFDRMGSSYNAFTSEDRTIYYGWVRIDDIAKQIELLADMMRSTLPNEEFDMEKNVVLEEIAMSKDSLDHVAFDFLQEKVFSGHPLAWPILGYEDTVKSMTRDQMWDYFQRRYTPDNMILVVAGKVEPDQVIETTEKLCGSWEKSKSSVVRKPPSFHTGVDVLELDRFKQQVVALTFPAVSASDKRSETASAVASILGGENSRFYWNIVQQGIAPRAGAYYLDYTDCGAMVLYGTCQPENAEALLEAMKKEAYRICTERVQDHEVDRMKNKLRTGLAVEVEIPYRRLTQIMDDMEYYGAPRTVDQMLADVDAISANTIQEYLEEFPIHTECHLTSAGPRRWPDGN